jgi:hypothetical protein
VADNSGRGYIVLLDPGVDFGVEKFEPPYS